MSRFLFARSIIFFLLILFAHSPAIQAQSADKYYLIKAGKMYDSEKNVFLKDKQILIKGNVIQKVGDKLDVPQGATVLDYGNATVTPGLIDAHTHLLFRQGPTDNLAYDGIMNSPETRVLRAVGYAKSYLNAGFTAIRDLGNSEQYLDLEVRNAIERGDFPGPRMMISGPIISAMDGQLYGIPVKEFDKYSSKEYSMVSGVEEARKAVKEHIARGVDVIKITVFGNRLVLTPEELKAIVQAAHSERVKVTAHCDRDWAVHAAIEAGVDGLEHGYGFRQSTLDTMAKRGIYLVPTDGSVDLRIHYLKSQNIKYDEAEIKQNFKPLQNRIMAAHKAGVRIVAGSDAYTDLSLPRGETAKHTISGFFDAGLPAADVLKTATSNAAVALGMENQIGVIKENAAADLAVFEGDMQKDFKKSLFDVKMVMKNGVVEYQK
ncbi:amidohydrolase family protein [Dyadobacter fermentans]|uniref:Amidohydrolase n=1 Tax=Dyadobacter fermentans (strain ATCC 700827 / DSM 18053 / CIP 107007 / KCTC 52180 / NS114) TaxID=471854 RepID=C6VUD8_DYAFD|nr:amidohydrolase family protein [Dyadobacter fermentans]ACT96620.1 amidohydrolase [Dyadobacter fermentans DSM 18053]